MRLKRSARDADFCLAWRANTPRSWPRCLGLCSSPGCDEHFPDLFRLLLGLYGDRYDFLFHLERILGLAAESWLDRPDDLKHLDAEREAQSDMVPVAGDVGRRVLCGSVRR